MSDQKLPGYTSVSSKALAKIAKGIAGETFQVRPDQVSAQLSDAEGELGLAVSTPLPQGVVEELVSSAERNLFTYSREQTVVLKEKMARISGHEIGAVTVSFSQIVEDKPKRRVE